MLKSCGRRPWRRTTSGSSASRTKLAEKQTPAPRRQRLKALSVRQLLKLRLCSRVRRVEDIATVLDRLSLPAAVEAQLDERQGPNRRSTRLVRPEEGPAFAGTSFDLRRVGVAFVLPDREDVRRDRPAAFSIGASSYSRPVPSATANHAASAGKASVDPLIRPRRNLSQSETGVHRLWRALEYE